MKPNEQPQTQPANSVGAVPVSEAPKDPLQQIHSLQQKDSPLLGTPAPTNMVNQYSYSDLQKVKSRRASLFYKLLFGCILTASLIAAAFFGLKLYSEVNANPDDRFKTMIVSILNEKNASYSIQSSSNFGLISAQYALSFNGDTPKAEGKVQIDVIDDSKSISANINVIVGDNSTAQNIQDLSLRSDGQNLTSSQRGLVTNKWVQVPYSLNFSEEDFMIQIFEVGSSFARPAVLPIGFAEHTSQSELLDVYSYDCREVSSRLIECLVKVDINKLQDIYSSIDQGEQDFLESFTLFIDTETNLPVELTSKHDNQKTEVIYEFSGEDVRVTEPAGQLSINQYRDFVNQFNASL